MNKQAYLIGRFQPCPHPGHRDLIRQICKKFGSVIIMVGSANRPATIKNPSSYEFRKQELVRFAERESLNVKVVPLNDYLYSDVNWKRDVLATIDHTLPEGTKPVLVGFDKEGNDYLHWFGSEGIEFEGFTSSVKISGSEVREDMFKRGQGSMPKTVFDDYNYFEEEKKKFSVYPYPETLSFLCADALVVCNDHVLLIKRKRAPGEGTWALPGGFKNQRETLFDAAIRELYEETGIKVPEKVIRGSVVDTKLFDDPRRSLGIPRISFVVHIKIAPNPDGTLPRVVAADDAAAVKWVNIYEILNGIPLFDDHQDIISAMTGIIASPAIFN